jgi:hypothetical protein
MPPRSILRGVGKRLGVTMRHETPKSPAEGMRALDAHPVAGVVGLQTRCITYFPPDMRHFNAHNRWCTANAVIRIISDPVFEQLAGAMRNRSHARGL